MATKDSITKQAAELIGKARIAKLDAQPMALAAGGFAKLIEKAAVECEGYPSPAEATARRALQLAGSKPILTPPAPVKKDTQDGGGEG